MALALSIFAHRKTPLLAGYFQRQRRHVGLGLYIMPRKFK